MMMLMARDRINYGGSVEFYNDVNNYNVTIEVPQNWIVWAAGEIKIVKQFFLKLLISEVEQASSSDEVIAIITQADYHADDVLKAT